MSENAVQFKACPAYHLKAGVDFETPGSDLPGYPPESAEDVKAVIDRYQVALFHLERSIAFINECFGSHKINDLVSCDGRLSTALNANNFHQIHAAVSTILTPLQPWAATAINTPEQTVQWMYCVHQSMVLLLEPLVPAILEEIAAEHVDEVKERLRFAKSEMSFTDEFEHDIVEMGQGSKQPGLFARLLNAIKQKFARKATTT